MDVKVFKDVSYGVYIVTSFDGDRKVGCVANSMMQITSDPASIAISLNHNNYTHDCVEKSGRFAVSICSEGTEPLTIGTFGFRSSKDSDKFNGIKYEMKSGLPVITDNCRGYIICDVTGKMETETHTVFLGKVAEAEVLPCSYKPMTYAYYHEVVKGRAPKNAPTYIDPELEKN